MNKKILIAALFFAFFVSSSQTVLAAKSPTPRITEIVGPMEAKRIHFEIRGVHGGDMIKVKYNLKTSKFNNVKYKIPKNAKRSGIVGAAASANGSAIDLFNLPQNYQKFIYEIKVKVQLPNKSWSSWSNTYSF